MNHYLFDAVILLFFCITIAALWVTMAGRGKARLALLEQVALLKKQQLYNRLILDTAPSLIFVVDEHLKIIAVNLTFAEVFGASPDGMVGVDLAVYIREEKVLSQFRMDTQYVLKKNLPLQGGELYLTNPQKEVRCFSLSRNVLHNGVSGVIIVGNDITTLKNALNVLKVTQDHYVKLVESSSNLILQISPTMTISYANAISRKHLGLEPSECLGVNWLDIIVENDKEKLARQFARWSAWATRKEERWECNIVTRAGVIKTMMWDIVIIWRNDTFMGLQLSGVDITAKRAQEEELRQTKDELQEANTNLMREQVEYQKLLGTYEQMIRGTLRTHVNNT